MSRQCNIIQAIGSAPTSHKLRRVPEVVDEATSPVLSSRIAGTRSLVHYKNRLRQRVICTSFSHLKT